ncbi:MAG: DUF3500 domain-containing protein [Planctomycetia bacterium]|nr:DUF3500 domain-containing protein [Planctomycetia bacterium]
MKHLVVVAIACSVLVAAGLLAPAPARSAEAAWLDGMARAARTWLATLPRADAAQVPFASDARRDWHYVPRSRPGLALRDMSEPQRAAATALLRAGLSTKGADRAEAIMALEAVLADLEGSSRRFRDPLNYAFVVFGTPGVVPWGWRVEGHHLSVNVTVAAEGRAAFTPLFTGSNPARVPSGPRAGERLQADEVELAFSLVSSLDARQLAAAALRGRSFGDIVAGPGRLDALARPEGLLATELTEAQRATLLRLIEAYVGLARDEAGRPYLDLVRAGLDTTRFAWAGGMRHGTAYYYRIHGPRVWIELDNTQGGGNHVHSLWRDPLNDFGRDDLRAHYASPGHAPAPGAGPAAPR